MHGGDGCVSYNLGQVYMQQQLDPAPLYRGSAVGQAYVVRYAVDRLYIALGALSSSWLSAPKCHSSARRLPGRLPAPIRGLVYVLLARQDWPRPSPKTRTRSSD